MSASNREGISKEIEVMVDPPTSPNEKKPRKGSDAPTEDDILEAVRREGYLLDQEVGTVLEDEGFHVQTSWPFEDPDEGESRELDVWAVKRIIHDGPVTLFVELFCECKSNVDRPLVFLTRRKGQIDATVNPEHFHFPHNHYQRRTSANSYSVLPPFQYLEIAKYHYWFRADQKAVQFAKIVRERDKWRAQHDGLYNGLLLPLAKAINYRRQIAWQGHASVVIGVPIVVSKSNLYEIDSGQLELIVTKKTHVSFLRSLQATNVKGAYIVDFVSFDGLKLYLEKTLMPFVVELAHHIKHYPNLFLDSQGS
jgi:hypothetical protein